VPFLVFYHSYINFFRGTPLYVQILNVHFGVIPPDLRKNQCADHCVCRSFAQFGSYFTWDVEMASDEVCYFTAGHQTDVFGFWQRIYCISKGLFPTCIGDSTGNYVLEQHDERAIFADLGTLFDGSTYLFHSHLFSQ
jgi:hypothetical protein